MKTNTIQTIKKATMRFAALVAAVAAPSAFAASQTWSNAPANALWVGSSNWIANASPGGINLTGNTMNNDVATFNTPIFGGIGDVANPILIDDATVAAARSRHLGGLTFDGLNCGAYVVTSLSPEVLPATGIPATGILYVSHNQTTRVNAAVTNIQTITVPMRVRLPSSTAGAYNIVNDSTNASAGLIIRTIIHDGANTRATTFNLSGVNAGENNIITNLSEGIGNATGGFTKSGTGTWKLAGTGTFPGASPLNINQGTLAVLAADAFGAATTATVTNAILRFDGVTLNQASLNLRNGGNLQANGTLSVNGVAVGNQTGNSCTLSTLTASDVFTVGTFLTVNSIVSGGAADSVLNTAGPGTLVFGQANTYIGKWSFNAKTNQIATPSALSTGVNANVGAGAIFDLTLLGASTFTPTTAGFGGSGTGTTVGTTAAAVVADVGGVLDLATKNINLTFTPTAFSGDTTHPALTMAQGTLALGGNTFFINNASGTPLGVGTYRLITQASGSITSGGGYAALISGSGMVGGAAADIVVSGGNVDLVISIYTPKNLVWTGGLNANWNINADANWLDGVIASVFNNSDVITFNSIGSTNPTVNLVGTLAPASAVVDTSANDYTFGGPGQIGGTASLTKVSAGTLNLNTVNTYAGGTVVSNGTLRIGANNALPSLGAGNVAVYGSGVIDLNNFSDNINGLNGNGAVDNQAGAASTLTVGNNDNSGDFSGVLKNTSGTLALTKVGNGTQTLSASNSYAGGTTLSAGTLAVGNAYALGTNTVTVNAGTLDVKTDLHVGSLAGSGGSIANNSTAATNTIFVEGGAATTTTASIVNGSGGGGLAVKIVNGSSLTFAGNNTYTGGTYVGSGSTFAIPNSPAAVGGFVIASNTAHLFLSGGSGTPGTPNSVTTVDGAKVTFNSGAEGKIWQAQFNGSATATNRFIGPVSAGQSLSFSNFLGVVEFANTNTANANFRFFNGGGISGGENTLFVFERVNVHTRDAQTVRLGAIAGGSSIAGIGDQAQLASWEIGGKNTSSAFHGYISGTNTAIVKVGSGTLTLDGTASYTNVVTLPDPFEPTNIVNFILSSNLITYSATTTVSNGTLKIVAPNNLTSSTNITLAGGTLDATTIGFSTNQTTLDYNSVEQATNTVVVTTGIMEIQAGKSLNGQGSLLGNVVTDAASTMNVGNPIGTMAISGSIALNGTVNMDLNRTNSPNNSDRITAGSFSGAGATLNVTDAGPALFTGTICQLFSGPVTAFTTVNLPASNGATTYVWTNKIAINGTIELLSGASPVDPNPTNITSAVTGGGTTLTLSWPSGHTGWTLQAQTNLINVGISGTWFDIAGSAATNQVILPINPANPTVFYRLKL